ncbi:hypothetical protein LQV63_29835 [Paenibacillus profundus]|uniref:Uncharacterized protein n=1 Tax=Paenibacillus profundus TaxID=1173085 RepID=A0ABS8YNP5_9BACL|nr:hypothetical protein [Paenibacillus profundus]MCE5173443.1 hypothetical protein [Paenibacillus profundus]
MANEALGQITNHADPTFGGFLRALIINRIEFAMENREIFQVLVKEVMYKEELKKELLPYIFEVATSRLTPVIELYKERGELMDIPTDRMLKLLFTFIGGFFVSRFVLLNKESIPEGELEDAIYFVLNGIRKSSSQQE